MQLRTLRYFLTLASEEHFARAAERCGVTQPTLSAALSALEEELGKRLVERDRRYVGLTPEGCAMLPWAQQMLAAHEGMLQSVEALGGPIHGEFRLGTIPAAMPAAGRLARALLASHPGVSLSVRSFTSREIVRGLKAFELDAGLTYLDHEPPSDMFSVALYEERYMFVACAGAGFDGRDSISWEDAAAAPLCLLHQGMQNRRILDARLAALGLAITPRATSDSYVVLLALVRSGGFATIMPDSYAGMVEGLRWARALRLEGDHSASRIGLIVADRAPMPPLAAAALAAAREVHRTGI
ncbi:MAG: LysR family transcriptional regulator [Sphingomonadaceae bacterium]